MSTEYDNVARTSRKYDGSGDSQEDRILRILIDARGGWVPAPRLAQVALQYARAVASLRKDGASISNRVEQHGRVRHGFYRLDQDRVGAVDQPVVKVAPKMQSSTVAMFSQPVRCWAGDL